MTADPLHQPTRGTDTGAGSLAAVPRLLRSDPVLAVLIGAADATVAVPEAAQAVVAAALAAFTERTPLLVVTATGLDAERLGDDLACLIAPEGDETDGPDAGAGRRRVGGPGHGAAGLGDAALRAGQPRDRDDGPPPGGAPRAHREARPRASAAAPGDRRPGPGPPAAARPPGGHGARGHTPRATGRRRRAPAPAGGHGLPARAPGGAPGGVRGARRHRRRLPLHGRRARPHRPLG